MLIASMRLQRASMRASSTRRLVRLLGCHTSLGVPRHGRLAHLPACTAAELATHCRRRPRLNHSNPISGVSTNAISLPK